MREEEEDERDCEEGEDEEEEEDEEECEGEDEIEEERLLSLAKSEEAVGRWIEEEELEAGSLLRRAGLAAEVWR